MSLLKWHFFKRFCTHLIFIYPHITLFFPDSFSFTFFTKHLMLHVYLRIWLLFVFPFKMQAPLGLRLFVCLMIRPCPAYDGFSIKICCKNEYLNPYVQKILNPLRFNFLICKINVMIALSTAVKFSKDQIIQWMWNYFQNYKGQLCFTEKI